MIYTRVANVPSENGCKRAGKSGVVAGLSLLWSVCTSSRGGVKQITQEDSSREKKADVGGVTYGSPHAQRMRQA